ncbi:MAG: hypothetical protein JWQ66_2952 [Mucilaginibacter sp.]|nr:hypothetical protein [Mucilaginibacter sp.]
MNKNDILTRLIKEGHITLDEAKLLDEVHPVYVPSIRPIYPYEWIPDLAPFWNTCDNNDAINHSRFIVTC